MWSFLWDCLFPVQCLGGCSQFDTWLCDECAQQALRPFWKEGAALENPLLRRLFALGDYKQPTLRRCIQGLKYNGWYGIATTIGRYASTLIAVEQYDWVIPVPLHRGRLRERGFNQAELLAHTTKIPLLPALRKIRPTESQVQLDREKRLKNLAGAFTLDFRYMEALTGAHCLLVDDVYSTGSTLRLCAEQLYRAQCASVDAMVVALNVK